MKTAFAAVTVALVAVAGAKAAADRQWQTGTCTRVGVARTLFVGDAVHERLPPGLNKPQQTEVATYVVETGERRYELQAMVAIGSDGLARRLTVGDLVTFAIDKKTAYLKFDDGEYRLLVRKDDRKRR
jgi:hypothetical protein